MYSENKLKADRAQSYEKKNYYWWFTMKINSRLIVHKLMKRKIIIGDLQWKLTQGWSCTKLWKEKLLLVIYSEN